MKKEQLIRANTLAFKIESYERHLNDFRRNEEAVQGELIAVYAEFISAEDYKRKLSQKIAQMKNELEAI